MTTGEEFVSFDKDGRVVRVEEKPEEKPPETETEQPAPIPQAPIPEGKVQRLIDRGRLILVASIFATILSGSLICYSVYFEYASRAQRSVVSYFPWRWNQTYTSSSSAFELFLISTGISAIILATSLLVFVRTKRNYGPKKDSLLDHSEDAATEGYDADTSAITTNSPVPPLPPPEVELPPILDREVDGATKALERSRERLSILGTAMKAEKRYIKELEDYVIETMAMRGFTTVVGQPKNNVQKSAPATKVSKSETNPHTSSQAGKPRTIPPAPSAEKRQGKNKGGDLKLQLRKEIEEKENLKQLAESIGELPGDSASS